MLLRHRTGDKQTAFAVYFYILFQKGVAIEQGNGNFIMESNNGIFFLFLFLLPPLYFSSGDIKINEMTTRMRTIPL